MADINQLITLGIGASPGSPTTFILVGLGTGAQLPPVLVTGRLVNLPVALDGQLVATLQLGNISTTGYTLFTYGNMVTEDDIQLITEDGEEFILDGFDFTVYPYIYVVELPDVIKPIEVD